MGTKRHLLRSRLTRRLAAVVIVYAGVFGLFSRPAAAGQVINAQESQSSFWSDIATPNPLQPYTAEYALVPPNCTTDCALWQGSVLFYMGPASNTALGALEGAAAMAPPSEQAYINRLVAHIQDITTPQLNGAGPAPVQPASQVVTQPDLKLAGASGQRGGEICYKYEEMKYCWGGSATQSGNGGCKQAYQTVAGEFSYDNNGAYAVDGNDFVDCSDHWQASPDDNISVNWCSYWRSGPFSDTTHDYMDYGMNLTETYSSNNATHGVWVRMDDYAGCGSVGNRGGAS